MKHGKEKISALILFAIVIITFIIITHLSSSDTNKESISVVYFHNNICESCNEDARFIDIFNSSVGKETEDISFDIKIYNIYLGDGDYMFRSYCNKYKIPEENMIVPMVFIGDSYLIGESEIESSLRDVFIKEKARLIKNKK